MLRTKTTDDVSTEAPEGTDTLRPTPPPRGAAITIIAQDPTVKDRTTNRVLTSQVTIPADKMEAGPRSHRFHVVDYDTSTKKAQPPADLTDGQGNFVDHFGNDGRLIDDKLIDDPAFRAQNVYAIAARVLAIFERYLGRRLPWSFNSHHLFLIPSAMAEANAFYAEEHQAVLFGYITREDGEVVHSSLSHDIVAHEVTHAILDGLRPRYVEPGLPDQLAFHEAFADLVALLSVSACRRSWTSSSAYPTKRAGSRRARSSSRRWRAECFSASPSSSATSSPGAAHCAGRSA